MKYLVFFTDISGHNLEYCHHIFHVAKDMSNIKFVFVVPKAFLKIQNRLQWCESDNVYFDYIDNDEYKKISKNNLLVRSFNISILFKKYFKRHAPKGAFVPTLHELAPLLPLILWEKTNISGIIYRIYLYEWRQSSILRKVLDAVKMYLLSKSSLFSNILILNDSAASKYLNCLFLSQKFKNIPDPYIPLPEFQKNSFRKANDIPEDFLLYSHIGSMNNSKGTLDYLKAIRLLVLDGLDDYNVVFAFVGKVSKEIRADFYNIIEELNNNVRIVVKDEFCEYETIAELCRESNLIVLPYKRTSQSSGIIGYASQFSVPVLIPDKGLLGKIVRKYNLGYLYRGSTVEDLAMAINGCLSLKKYITPTRQYCIDNSLETFSNTIKEIIYEDIN